MYIDVPSVYIGPTEQSFTGPNSLRSWSQLNRLDRNRSSIESYSSTESDWDHCYTNFVWLIQTRPRINSSTTKFSMNIFHYKNWACSCLWILSRRNNSSSLVMFNCHYLNRFHWEQQPFDKVYFDPTIRINCYFNNFKNPIDHFFFFWRYFRIKPDSWEGVFKGIWEMCRMNNIFIVN